MMKVERATAAPAEMKTEDVEWSCCVCGALEAAGTLAMAAVAALTRHAPVLAGSAALRACAACTALLTDLERAESEYARHKAAFKAVLARNPLLAHVKLESSPSSSLPPSPLPPSPAHSHHSSEEEPLAVTKQKRTQNGNKRVKKASVAKKTRKSSNRTSKRTNKDSTDATDEWNLASQLVEHLKSAADAAVKKETPFGCDPRIDVKIEFEEGESFPPADPELDRALVRVCGGKGRGGRPRSARGRPPGARGRRVEPKELHGCDLCDNKYTSLKRLEQHREKHDKGPFICEVCGARYKHKRACDIHVALHRGISDWKCLECDKLFPSRGALQRHNNIHTGTPCYQCDQCGKSFIHTSSFKMHKLSHTGLKAHACTVCGLRLMTRSHLKRHARVHSGEKRHECSLCGKRFSERYNLAAHSRAHAAAGDTPPGSGAQAPRRRLFRCLYCNERFERRYMLERHTATTHGQTLERAPPTPRNTMSKLLKAQAQGHGTQDKAAGKPGSEAATVGVSWSGAFQEFGLRPPLSSFPPSSPPPPH